MSTLDIACAAEGGYVAHSAAMLDSALTHSGGLDVRVRYLHGPDMPADSVERLENMFERRGARISFIEVPDEACVGLPTKGFTRKATWYRIFLPELLPEVRRILYLDADLLALDSLEPLWEVDVTGWYVAAVTNVFQQNHLRRPHRLGLAGPQVYFNAGVLLMNLDLMRRDSCSTALKRYGVTHAPEWRDQDALNVVLGSRRLPLHPRWNCMNSVLTFPRSADVFGPEAVEEARRRPGIRHFEGPEQNKPWHYLGDNDTRELYLAHRRNTPWPHWRPEGRTPLNVLKRLAGKPMCRRALRRGERDALNA